MYTLFQDLTTMEYVQG